MKPLAWLLLLAGGNAFGCFYATLDSETLDAKAAGARGAVETPADAGVSPEGYTTSLDTPSIELATGDTTRDPCVQTTAQARTILTRNCSGCHAPPANMGGFQSILDFPRLVTLTSSNVQDPLTGQPVRLVIPGDPDRSRVYLRAQSGEMPPRPIDASLAPLPRPSLSDVSILRTWIESCLPDAPVPVAASGDAGAAD